MCNAIHLVEPLEAHELTISHEAKPDRKDSADSEYKSAISRLYSIIEGWSFDLARIDQNTMEDEALNNSKTHRNGSLAQKCVNHLRHSASTYPSLLELLNRPDTCCSSVIDRHVLHVERHRLVALGKKRILDAIGQQYPWLKAECDRQKYREGVEEQPGEYVVPFHPFKGAKLKELDSDYLVRLLGQSWVRRSLRCRIERHLAERNV